MRERLRHYRRHVGYAAILAVAIALFGADPVSGQPFAAQIQALLRRSNTWLGTQTFTNVTVTGTCTGCGGGTSLTFPSGATLAEDASDFPAFRHGTTAQGVRFYNTFTDAGNYERFVISPSYFGANTGFALIAESLGTGSTSRPFYIGNLGSGAVNLRSNNVTVMSVSAANGVQLGADNTYDIGASGATRPKNVYVAGAIRQLGSITTVGTFGAPAIVAQARTVAATNTGTASVAAYTVGAADGTFEVGCNVLVTTSTTHSFSCDVTYTDEGNTARTMVIPIQGLGGNFATNGLITNALGAGPYESSVMTIRAKAATAITIRTSAGGTFTAVVYNIDGTIKQVG